MPRKPIVVRFEQGPFMHEEVFTSKADAEHWREMMQATLDHADKINFDLSRYAAGLAYSVRRYGGAETRDAWLRADAPPDMWMRGQVFGLRDLKDRIRAVLLGRRFK